MLAEQRPTLARAGARTGRLAVVTVVPRTLGLRLVTPLATAAARLCHFREQSRTHVTVVDGALP